MAVHNIDLQVTHAIFDDKTNLYLEERPFYQNSSIRNKRRSLLLDDEKEYIDLLDSTCVHILATNKVAKKLGGRETITHVRNCLRQRVRAARHHGANISLEHTFTDMVHRNDMHPASGLEDHLRGQKIKLQLLASDIEAMMLFRQLDARLVKAEIIPEALSRGHDLYKLHPLANDSLISLRLARVG